MNHKSGTMNSRQYKLFVPHRVTWMLFSFFYLFAISPLTSRAQDNGLLEPEFAEPIRNVTVPIGREAVLSCIINHLGDYKVGWLRAEDQTILSLHRRVVTHNGRVSVSHDGAKTWNLHLRQIKETDRACYVCQINTAIMKKQEGCIEVQVPPDILDDASTSDVTVNEGDNATLVCRASGRPAPRIVWRREDGDKIILKSNGALSHNGPYGLGSSSSSSSFVSSTGSHFMHHSGSSSGLAAVEPWAGGTGAAAAVDSSLSSSSSSMPRGSVARKSSNTVSLGNNKGSAKNNTAQRSQRQAPHSHYDSLPHSVFHREKEKLLLHKDAAALASAEWSYPTRSIKVDNYVGDILRLIRVNRRLMGAYMCIASNDVPPAVSKRVTLNINFEPSVKVETQLLGAPTGSEIKMQCHVEAYPPAVNYWQRGRQEEMLLQGKKYQLEEDRVSYKVLMSLIIRDFNADDVGSYACISSNSLGKAEGTIRLYEIKINTPKPVPAFMDITRGAERAPIDDGQHQRSEADKLSRATMPDNSERLARKPDVTYASRNRSTPLGMPGQSQIQNSGSPSYYQLRPDFCLFSLAVLLLH